MMIKSATQSRIKRNRKPENIGSSAISSEIPTVYTLVGENEKLIISIIAEQAMPVIRL